MISHPYWCEVRSSKRSRRIERKHASDASKESIASFCSVKKSKKLQFLRNVNGYLAADTT